MSVQEPTERGQRGSAEDLALMLGYPGAIPGRPPVYAYLRVLRQRMWLIVIVALAASLTASAFSYLSKPVYRASMKLVVGTGGKQFQPGLGEFAEPFNQTISSLIESDIVARTVIENRDLPIAPQQLLNELDVTSRPESSVLEVDYDATTPALAVTVLDELAKAFPPLVQARLGEGIARTGAQDDVSVPIAVRVFDPPRALATPVSPRPVRNMVVAGLLGLALGIVFAFVLEAFRDPREDIMLPDERDIAGDLP